MISGTVKWINGKDREWNCPHVDKCNLLLERNGELEVYYTDWPEPKDHYKYVFLHELLTEDDLVPGRQRIFCECKKESK